MNWHLPKFGWQRLGGQILPGIVSNLVVGLLAWSGSLQPLENLASVLLFRLRGELPWDDRVVVVAIDDASLKQIGRFPWNRQRYTQLLNRLTEAETSVVAIDMLWSEPSPEDAPLEQALLNQGRVVLAQAWDTTGHPLLPIAKFQQAAIALGHIHKQEGLDSIVRSVELELQAVPILGVATLQAYSLVAAPVPLPPLDRPLMLNWLRRGQQIPTYSFVDVIEGRVPTPALRGKIVFLGVTATGIDTLVTPFDRNPPTSGVYLQATLLVNLLHQNWLRSPSPVCLLLGLGLVGPLLSAGLLRFRTGQQVVIGLAVSGLWIVGSVLLLQMNYSVPVATPIALVLLTTSTVIVSERLRINDLLQQQVQQLWQAYSSDVVVSRADQLGQIAQSLLYHPISMQRVIQLAALAEQFGRSQATQAAIARSLPTGLVAATLDGTVWFCNPVATDWLQIAIGDSLLKLIPTWIRATDWTLALECVQQNRPSPIREVNLSLSESSSEFSELPTELPGQSRSTPTPNDRPVDRWFAVRFEPLVYHRTPLSKPTIANSPNESPLQVEGLLLIVEEITQSKRDAIAQLQLNQQLMERTTQLELLNKEMETFSYAVSHDLRAPLRRISGFCQLLVEINEERQDDLEQSYLNRIQVSVQRMGELIEDLLQLSRLTRSEMHPTTVNLSAMVQEIVQGLQQSQPDRPAEFLIASNLTAYADERLLKIVLENLLDNAWKYTNQRSHTRIEVGTIAQLDTGEPIPEDKVGFFVQDNGAGFDMAYADRLFAAFQRLHTEAEFPGTGVGLMTAQRIIHRHKGRIWAKSEVDRGAAFYFTLQKPQKFTHPGLF